MKKPRKILCPVDFSPFSEAGLENAAAIAQSTRATLLIAFVQSPSHSNPDIEKDNIDRLKKILPYAEDVPYQHFLLTGDPVEEIVALAISEAVDLIVMGTHGRTGIMHLLMGSVAEGVHRQAPCPVAAYHDKFLPGTSK